MPLHTPLQCPLAPIPHRITKPTGRLPKALLRRSSSSSPRKHSRPSTPSRTKLHSTNAPVSSQSLLLPPGEAPPKDVASAITYLQEHTFTPMPENFKGLHRDKIASILTFRRTIPPYVPIHLLQQLLAKPTATARELAKLEQAGNIRRIVIPGQSDDGGVVPCEYLYTLVENSSLSQELKDKFLEVLTKNPTAPELPAYFFDAKEGRMLVQGGFLTLPARAKSIVTAESSETGTLLSLAAMAPSGSDEAVGGKGRVTALGYSEPSKESSSLTEMYAISLPSLGLFLGLLAKARECLMGMLRKARSEGGVTVKVLRERWNGQGSENMIGKMRKWREFYGIAVETVLGDLAGRNEVEAFMTTVGVAVRLMR